MAKRASAGDRQQRHEELRAKGIPWAGVAVGILGGALIGVVAVQLRPRVPEARSELGDGRSTGDVARDGQLDALVSALDGAGRKRLAQGLRRYEDGARHELPLPRALFGEAAAPVRFTYWVDVMSRHSAELHQALRDVHLLIGGDEVALEVRQLPGDGGCKDSASAETSTRCLAALALICAEGRRGALDVVTELIGDERIGHAPGRHAGSAMQRVLQPSTVREVAAKAIGAPEALDACLRDAATLSKLDADADLARSVGATAHSVLLNGKRVDPYPQLLRALALTKSSSRHPAFAVLPNADD